MWDPICLRRMDFRTIPIVIALIVISILVIASTTMPGEGNIEQMTLSPLAKNQMKAFALGSIVYAAMVCFDYRKLRNWTWILYIGCVVSLIGLFFTAPIHNVRRWYRFPFLPFDFQPSEYAKLVLVITLSWFLEKKKEAVATWTTFFQSSLIIFIPFALILKQPDLGTSLILCPISLVILYFGGIKRKIIRGLFVFAIVLFSVVFSIFLGFLSHEEMKPIVTQVMKEYQYERLNPNTYHQKAGQTAIALGKITGTGLGKSEFTGRKWLPYAYTDSVFPAFTEQFGMLGAFFLLLLFFGLIYCSFQVIAVARDPFGRLLSSGISVYLAMHVIVNIGMMCGFLPITGVPLILVSYGGSSVLSTMTALGLLQSVYARRFTFS
jgi:rod shape determining protein RodA